jgi:hypothetical protein
MKLQDFKVESEAEDTYHLTHPVSGKKFTVEKKSLAPKAHEMIKKMCSGGSVALANGGKVPAALASSDASQSPDILQTLLSAPIAPATDASGGVQYDPSTDPLAGATPSTPMFDTQPGNKYNALPGEERVAKAAGAQDQAPVASVKQAAIQTANAQPQPQQPQVDPFGQYAQAQNANVDTQMKAAQDLMRTMGSSNGASQQAFADAQKQMQAMESPDQTIARHHAADAQFMQHLQDSQIDPNRYWKNTSTAGKILAGLSMVIGGAGAGANGKNLAYETIHNAINNDIDAQKADQSKTMNLWKMNRDATQDDLSAHLQTKNQLLSLAQMKAAQAGANIQSAQGKFQLTQLMGQLQAQKNDNNRQQGLLRMNQMAGGPNGQAMGVDPSLLIPASANPAAKQKALDEIEAAQNTANGRDKALSAFDDYAKEATAVRTVGGLRTPEAAARFRAAISPMFKDIEGSARQQAIEALIDHVSPSAFDSDLTGKTQGKRQAVMDFMDSKASAPTFKSLTGMDLGNFASTSANAFDRDPKLRQMAQVAKAYPNDPASKAFFKKYGSGGK